LSNKGLSLKQAVRGLSSADKGGSSDADVCSFWSKNLLFFQNLWRVISFNSNYLRRCFGQGDSKRT